MTDLQLAKAILNRDPVVTQEFLFARCYPLFKTLFNNYHTDCETVRELINEVYLFIMLPGRKTGVSKLAGYSGERPLEGWVWVVAKHYCFYLYSKKMNRDDNVSLDDDRKVRLCESLSENDDMDTLNIDDIRPFILSLPKGNYRTVLELHYLEQMAHSEIMKKIGVVGKYYYIIHKRAKELLREALRKGGLI